MIAAGRIHNRGVGRLRGDDGAFSRRGVSSHMPFSRSVARFASDSEFRDGASQVFGAPVQLRLPSNGMALNAARVPDGEPTPLTGRSQEHVLHRQPPLVSQIEDERELVQFAPRLSGQPIALHVVRAGRHHHRQPNTRQIGNVVRIDPLHSEKFLGIGIDQVDPKLLAAPFELIGPAARRQFDLVEWSDDRTLVRDLRHGAMKTAMPTGVLVRMAGAAFLRRDKPAFMAHSGKWVVASF